MSSPEPIASPSADPEEVHRQLTLVLPKIEAGGAGAALLAGPGGIGRGMVVSAIQEEATRRGWEILSGAGTPELREVPRGLVLRALRSLVRGGALPGTSDPATAAGSAALSMALVPLLSEERRSTASARALPPSPAPTGRPGAAPVDWAPPTSVTSADVDAFLLERLRTTSERRPVLLTLEDVEWADDLSFWLVRRLLHRQGFPRTFVLLTLDRELQSRVPADLLVPPAAPFVWAQWDLEQGGKGSGAVEQATSGAWPSGEEERDQDILAHAAVVGMEFQEDLLTQVVGLPAAEVAASLRRAEQRGKLLMTDEGFRFPSQAIWTWALGDRPGVVRRRHLKVAQVLERLHPEPHGRVVFDLARHYEGAQVPSKAFSYLLKSAEVSILAGATREAEDRLRKALTLLPDLPPNERVPCEVSVYRRLAEADRLLGNVEQAAEAMRQAIALAEKARTPPADIARMEVVLTRLLYEVSKIESMDQVIRSAEAHAEASGEASAIAEVAARKAVQLGLAGKGEAAVKELDRATAILPTSAPPAVKALVHGSAFDLWFMGMMPDIARARSGVRASREGWEQAGLRYEVMRTLDHEALLADAAGDWDGALRHYRRMAEEAQRSGFVILTITGRGNEAETLAEVGRLDEAQVALEQARRSLSLLDDIQEDSQIDLVTALLAWKEGRGAEALKHIDHAFARFGPGGRAEMGDQFLFLKARILYSLGEKEEARKILEGLPSVTPVLRSPTFQAEWNKILAKPA